MPEFWIIRVDDFNSISLLKFWREHPLLQRYIGLSATDASADFAMNNGAFTGHSYTPWGRRNIQNVHGEFSGATCQQVTRSAIAISLPSQAVSSSGSFFE